MADGPLPPGRPAGTAGRAGRRITAGRALPGRRLLALVLAPALVAPLTACGDGGPVAPLPVRAPVPTTPAVPAPVTTPPPSTATTPATVAPTVRVPAAAPTSPRPTRGTPSPSPSRPPDACLGPVRYDVVLAETELALLRSLCFATGGVLRLIGIGPGEVSVDREDLVSGSYEAGVVDIRFVRAGTVVVTIPQNGTDHRVTVVVV
ncbi:hypothetical protein [Micromonospora sp. NPDC126480]|uniref:hypothetical protein n=1 Tax=Micromonospora sp. NPDC126480 TaxID=3155312 RepID=UPI003318E664